jgi:DNA-binding response OmpR family regulator
MKILVNEETSEMSRHLNFYFLNKGYQLQIMPVGKKLLDQPHLDEFDLLILDLELCGLDAVEVASRLKSKRQDVLVLMLTNRLHLIRSKIGLNLGADEYLIRPFDSRELVISVRRLVEQIAQSRDNPTASSTELELYYSSRVIRLGSLYVSLTENELKTLDFCLKNQVRLIKTEELAQLIWHNQEPENLKRVYQIVQNLRRKLRIDRYSPGVIQFDTVLRQGFTFKATVLIIPAPTPTMETLIT